MIGSLLEPFSAGFKDSNKERSVTATFWPIPTDSCQRLLGWFALFLSSETLLINRQLMGLVVQRTGGRDAGGRTRTFENHNPQ